MPRFHYKAISSSGTPLSGELEAASREAVIDHLRNAGHLPVRADPVAARFAFLSELHARLRAGTRITRGHVVAFTRELATLLNAGLPLDVALRTLERTSGNGPMAALTGNIRSGIQGGRSLSDALGEHPEAFDRLYVNIIRAGEAGGAVHSVMAKLADYLESMATLRSTVATALIYPAILVVVALASLIAMLTFVVPQFIPLFEDAGATLPLLTQFVFWIAALFRDYWWLLVLAVGIGAWLGNRQLAEPGARARFDAWCLRTPVLGDLLTKIETARFARTLGTLLENGVPLLSGIHLSRDVIVNRAIADGMQTVSASLEQGRGLSRPLHDEGQLPPLALQLIEVGEESGQLPEMLARVADIFDREVQTGLRRLLTILEPVLILGLGGMIAVIIISVLVAILGLNELVV